MITIRNGEIDGIKNINRNKVNSKRRRFALAASNNKIYNIHVVILCIYMKKKKQPNYPIRISSVVVVIVHKKYICIGTYE